MAGTTKKLWPMFDSSGLPIDGATFTYNDVNTNAIVATFVEVWAGLYTATCSTGIYNVFQNGSIRNDLSPCVHVDANSIPRVGGTISYGSGSDGSYTLDGTQATVAGLFTKDSGTHYTLLRDAYFNLLTINSGITLATAGWRIFCNSGIGGTGIIDNSGATGGSGTAASGQTQGAGGAATADTTGNYLPSGGQGGAGGNGGYTGHAPVAGVAGGSISAYWNTVVGLAGMVGGNGGNNGSQGAGGGAATGTLLPSGAGSMRNTWAAVLVRAFNSTTVYAPGYNQTNGGSGGGSRGLSGTWGAGGGGAAAGNNGGTIVIVARILSGSLTIQANGGNGGNGGGGANGSGANADGGGGGAGGNGGNGGQVFILYGIDSSTNVYSVVGGTGGLAGAKGSGSSGGTDGVAGQAGGSGVAGIVQRFII